MPVKTLIDPRVPTRPPAFAAVAGAILVVAAAVGARYGFTTAVAVGALALPVTLRRLRDAGLSLLLAPLVLLPAVGLVAVVVFALVPPLGAVPPSPTRLRTLPTSSWGSAVAAVLLAGGLGALLIFIGANVFEYYGWALFVGLPFVLGLIAGLVHSAREPRAAAECAAVGVLAGLLASLIVMAVALEGAICIVMAAPLVVLLCALGGATAAALRPAATVASGRLLCAAALAVPALMGGEKTQQVEPPLRSVTTSIVINAPPAVVWRHVVSVEPLAPPRELLFRLGIAYPLRATIDGEGVGAVRRCTFSTGDFVEPITAWVEPRLLAFDVASQPPPMRELSPWGTVRPPHLDGFLVSERGEFRLALLPSGRTLLTGTSWYRNKMWPNRYWGAFADFLMHRIHRRVLEHVARAAETDVDTGAAAGRTAHFNDADAHAARKSEAQARRPWEGRRGISADAVRA